MCHIQQNMQKASSCLLCKSVVACGISSRKHLTYYGKVRVLLHVLSPVESTQLAYYVRALLDVLSSNTQVAFYVSAVGCGISSRKHSTCLPCKSAVGCAISSRTCRKHQVAYYVRVLLHVVSPVESTQVAQYIRVLLDVLSPVEST